MPGCPHHITHRGNLRADVFLTEADRALYKSLLMQTSQQFGLEIWAYCMMTNHVHLVAVPRDEAALGLAIGRAHQRYAAAINAQNGWTGHLWAKRYFSTPLDHGHLWTAVKYVELNPVRARMVAAAQEHPYSSTKCHGGECEDALLSPGRPFPGPFATNWYQWLADGLDLSTEAQLRMATYTGRPFGSPQFIERLETAASRPLAPQKRGHKPKSDEPETNIRDLFED